MKSYILVISVIVTSAPVNALDKKGLAYYATLNTIYYVLGNPLEDLCRKCVLASQAYPKVLAVAHLVQNHDVNIALETVLEFNPKDRAADIKLIDTMQSFLKKVEQNLDMRRKKIRRRNTNDFLQQLFETLGNLDERETEVITKMMEIQLKKGNNSEFMKLFKIPVVRRSFISSLQTLTVAPQTNWINIAKKLRSPYESSGRMSDKLEKPNIRSKNQNMPEELRSWVNNLFNNNKDVILNEFYNVLDGLKKYSKTTNIVSLKQKKDSRQSKEKENRKETGLEKDISDALRDPGKLINIVKNALMTLMFDQYKNVDEKKRDVVQKQLQSVRSDSTKFLQETSTCKGKNVKEPIPTEVEEPKSKEVKESKEKEIKGTKQEEIAELNARLADPTEEPLSESRIKERQEEIEELNARLAEPTEEPESETKSSYVTGTTGRIKSTTKPTATEEPEEDSRITGRQKEIAELNARTADATEEPEPESRIKERQEEIEELNARLAEPTEESESQTKSCFVTRTTKPTPISKEDEQQPHKKKKVLRMKKGDVLASLSPTNAEETTTIKIFNILSLIAKKPISKRKTSTTTISSRKNNAKKKIDAQTNKLVSKKNMYNSETTTRDDSIFESQSAEKKITTEKSLMESFREILSLDQNSESMESNQFKSKDNSQEPNSKQITIEKETIRRVTEKKGKVKTKNKAEKQGTEEQGSKNSQELKVRFNNMARSSKNNLQVDLIRRADRNKGNVDEESTNSRENVAEISAESDALNRALVEQEREDLTATIF